MTVFARESTPIPGVKNVLDEVPAGAPQTILLLGSDRRFADGKAQTRRARTRSSSCAWTPTRRRRRSCRSRATSRSRSPASAPTRSTPPTTTAARSSRCARCARCWASRSTTSSTSNFGGFARAVNRLGCVYADVDRRYFNDNAGGPGGLRDDRPQARLSEAVRPGRAGLRALPPPRTRTSCAPPASRSSCARRRSRSALGKLFGDRKELLRIFGRYTQTDISQGNDAAILGCSSSPTSRPRPRSARDPLPGRGHGRRLRRDLGRQAA